jgi:hypothetical protein
MKNQSLLADGLLCALPVKGVVFVLLGPPVYHRRCTTGSLLSLLLENFTGQKLTNYLYPAMYITGESHHDLCRS